MITKTPKFNYDETKLELDKILNDIRMNNLTIEELIIQYKRANELIKLMNKYLKTAQNLIKEIK